MSEDRAPTRAVAPLRIEVVHALPDRAARVQLELPPGATVADALQAVAGREPFAGLDLGGAAVGIYGERVDRDRSLADHDRVEIYRPLLLDPVEARRRRGRAARTS
jgi:putative ubiquitin-RnfH superfamily antitoxin RatB of RatAB toxin-antitoxin module